MTTLALDKQITANGAIVTGEKLPRTGMSLERAGHIFENLIRNSLLFRSPAPPVIEVTAGPDPQDSGRWLIRVADNGIGIDPNDREAVFKPFMRINGRKYPGAGLGLTVCRNLVEGCGGRIWMEGSPEGGCLCLFTLPTAE